MSSTTPLSGRRAQAARNDELILAAARAVFVADPTAPVSAVAERAGVGISALYRRYPSKEDLLRTVCGNGLATYISVVEEALAETGDVWEAFAGFLRRVVAADTHSITLSLAGTFTPTADLNEAVGRAEDLDAALLERARDAGAIRADIETTDLAMILEQMAAIRLGDEARTAELRQRYLELVLEALRAPGGGELPGAPPTIEELRSRWQR